MLNIIMRFTKFEMFWEANKKTIYKSDLFPLTNSEIVTRLKGNYSNN